MTQTLQLPEDIRKAIEQEAENLYPYVWPKNKEGEDFTPRPGQGAPFSKKVKKIQAAYIAGATARALACIQKDEEIARLRRELEKIANPLKYLKEEADKEGAQLNGQMAILMSKDAEWLKSIATEALKQ